MSQIAGDKYAAQYFASGRLAMAWKIYNKIKLQEKLDEHEKKRQEPNISAEVDLDKVKKHQAILLAQQHADNKGLRTQLNAHGLEGVELRKFLHNILIDNHSDKNPDEKFNEKNNNLVIAANQVLQLMKDGDFKIYEEELEHRRIPKP